MRSEWVEGGECEGERWVEGVVGAGGWRWVGVVGWVEVGAVGGGENVRSSRG